MGSRPGRFKTGRPDNPDEIAVMAPFHGGADGLMVAITGPSQDGTASMDLPWDEIVRLRDFLSTKLPAVKLRGMRYHRPIDIEFRDVAAAVEGAYWRRHAGWMNPEEVIAADGKVILDPAQLDARMDEYALTL